jgi:ABC-2 type transport system permease protein
MGLKRYLRLYFLIIGQYIKARMQYRVDFMVSSVGIVFQNAAGYLSLWVLFRSIPELQGWKYDELVFLYAFAVLSVTPSQIFFDNTWQIRNHVQQGTFIKYYFKPINMMFYYMSEVLDLKGFAQAAFALVLLVVSSVNLGMQWSLLQVLGMLVLLVSSSLIMISFLVIASSTCFWITNSFSILSFFFRFREYARYPMTIFTGFFRFLFTFIIPIGFVAYYPSQLVLRPNDSGYLVFMTPLIGGALFAIACLVWSRGVRAWSGTGS